MNDNNLNNTNTTPEVGTANNSSDANTAQDVPTADSSSKTVPQTNSDSNVNIINAESLIGEAANVSEVVPRENLANIDVAVTTPVVSTNIGQKGDETSNSNEASTMKEKMKNAELNYKPPSKFKMFLLIVFFVLLIGFVIFLPEINDRIIKHKSGYQGEVNSEITTGKLNCVLTDNDDTLNYDYTSVFVFVDNKLKSMKFTSIIRGDITLDEVELDSLAEKCKLINDNVKGIEGVTVKCEYMSGELTQRQTFDFSTIDVEKVTAAYTEAGGQYPKYGYDYDIDEVKKDMQSSGYICKKEAN